MQGEKVKKELRDSAASLSAGCRGPRQLDNAWALPANCTCPRVRGSAHSWTSSLSHTVHSKPQRGPPALGFSDAIRQGGTKGKSHTYKGLSNTMTLLGQLEKDANASPGLTANFPRGHSDRPALHTHQYLPKSHCLWNQLIKAIIYSAAVSPSN